MVLGLEADGYPKMKIQKEQSLTRIKNFTKVNLLSIM